VLLGLAKNAGYSFAASDARVALPFLNFAPTLLADTWSDGGQLL
jgi:hypothetical protein